MIILLFILWGIFNGKITLEVAIIGAILSLALTIFTKKFFYKEKRTTKNIIREDFLTILYFGVLIKEIILANIAVLGIILSPKIEIQPCFCTFKTNLKDPIHRVLLANSITLTPGTITVSIRDNELKVHCLDKSLAEGLNDSIFVKLLTRLENTV